MKHVLMFSFAVCLLSGCSLLFPMHPGLHAFGVVTRADKGTPVEGASISVFGSTLRAGVGGCFKFQLADACRLISKSRTSARDCRSRCHREATSRSRWPWPRKEPARTARCPGSSGVNKPQRGRLVWVKQDHSLRPGRWSRQRLRGRPRAHHERKPCARTPVFYARLSWPRGSQRLRPACRQLPRSLKNPHLGGISRCRRDRRIRAGQKMPGRDACRTQGDLGARPCFRSRWPWDPRSPSP